MVWLCPSSHHFLQDLCAGGGDPASSLVLQGQSRALSLGALLSGTEGVAALEGGPLLVMPLGPWGTVPVPPPWSWMVHSRK